MKRASMCYVPVITNKISKKFREHNVDLVFSNQNKLKNLLGSTKDKVDKFKKSGIYAIKCEDCDGVYYGQTKRTFEKRFKEHNLYIKQNKPQCSAIAEHAIKHKHSNLNLNNLSVKKHISDERKLDAYESYYIQKDNNAINADNGNITSYLFSLI